MERLPTGENSIDRVEKYARALPGVCEVVYLTSPGAIPLPGERKTVALSDSTASALLGAFPLEGFDDIFYFYADCPLLDVELSAAMYRTHTRYLAHYSFADGYPYGITPEIVSLQVVAKLRSLAESVSDPLDRETLFKVIQEDINAFDIETELAPVDQRLLRVSLSADTLRNYTILTRLIEAGAAGAAETTRAISEHPEFLRSLPAYVSVQIVDGCPQRCSYCPFPEFGGPILERRGEMPIGRFERIVEQTKRFCDDAVIGVSLWGEPALHSEIVHVIETAATVPGLSVVVETSGVGWKTELLESIVERCGDSVTWIVSLDSATRELYRRLRGTGFTDAVGTAEWLIEHAGENVYVQAVRMTENEEELESFYRHWKERTERVIVQKYSTFGGLLPERKVTDLSPITRFPCWHLKRDLCVLLDGAAPVCREDVKRTRELGNVFEQDIAEIWERGVEWYDLHVAEEYPELCRNCDEYYTFNF